MKKILIGSSILFFLFSCKEKKENLPQQSKNPTQYQKPQFVPLTAQNIDSFIAWASASGVNEKERVRGEINKMSRDTTISDLLFERFDRVSTGDISYSLVVLSIIGELKQTRNISRFEKIVWQRIPASSSDLHGGLDSADLIEILASKAVESIAWIKTPESDKSILRVIREHSSQPIRAAAIDAYLFSKGDSEEAKQYLLRIVRKEDAPFIYKARFKDGKGDKSFNEAIERFYKQFPEAIAAAPGDPTEKVEADTSRPEKLINPPPRKSN